MVHSVTRGWQDIWVLLGVMGYMQSPIPCPMEGCPVTSSIDIAPSFTKNLPQKGPVPQSAFFRPGGDGGQLSQGSGDQGDAAHDGASGVSGSAKRQAITRSVFVRLRPLWQRCHTTRGSSREYWRLRLWGLSRHRRAVQTAGDGV